MPAGGLSARPHRVVRFPFDATVLVAHRGAHDESHAENSPSAFARAVELGYKAVELDACNLADGSLVVRHDAWLELSDERVAIPTLHPDDARVVAAGLQPLEPILEVLAASNVLVVFDWKGFGYEDRAVRLLDDHGLTSRTIVSTSVEEALLRFKSLEPQLCTGLTAPGLSKRLPPAPVLPLLARRWRCEAVMLDQAFVSQAAVTAVREAGLGLFLWTAQTEEDVARLRAYAPDGIMTDLAQAG